MVLRGGSVEELVQVCWELTPENREREINGLVAAAEATGCGKCSIVTWEQEDTILQGSLSISVVPAWRL